MVLPPKVDVCCRNHILQLFRDLSCFSLFFLRTFNSRVYEELIHYGQINSGRAIPGNRINNLLLEIEAKERLINNRRAYNITDFEIDVLSDVLSAYRLELNSLTGGV